MRKMEMTLRVSFYYKFCLVEGIEIPLLIYSLSSPYLVNIHKSQNPYTNSFTFFPI